MELAIGRPRSTTLASRRFVVLGALLFIALVASVAAPLLTYSTTLAMFGLAHVATEIRYVDGRFGRRVGRRTLHALVALLGAVVVLRLAAIAGLAAILPLGAMELFIGCALCATVLPSVAAGDWFSWRVGIALLVLLALAFGVTVAPAVALLALSILHNITPVGFLAEALRGRQRRIAMTASIIVFAAIPLVILTGLPQSLIAAAGWHNFEQALLPVGPLANHLGVYVPAAWHLEHFAIYIFSAVTFLQCAHYITVIGVLPTIGNAEAEPLFRWPSWPVFAAIVAAVTAVLFVHFYIDFSSARAWYGVAASVHAWIEIPLLLFALAPAVRSTEAG